MKKIITVILITLLLIGSVYAGEENVIYIKNGGILLLKTNEKADIEFKGFYNKEIKLISTSKDKAVIYFGPIKKFVSFSKDDGSLFKGKTRLKVGGKVIFYETKEMTVAFTLEEALEDSIKIKVTFGSAPPAPKIWPWQKIKIAIAQFK